MELASKYNPADVEGKWYQYWLDNKLFSSKPDGREPYTVVIPPPNVTGVLHMGHMLNNTIQDILVRGSRHPAGILAFHAGTAYQNILYGIIKHVSHVQHTGDVGGRDDDGVRLTTIGFRTE